MQQIADHIVRCRDEWTNETVVLDEEIRAIKWNLWHGQVDRAMQQLEELIADMAMLREQCDESAGRIWQLAQALLTYIRQNKTAIVDYGARYRSGRRIASSLAESAVATLVARRMVKKQQMQWSLNGAHRLLQVRAAVLNGDLSKRLAWRSPEPTYQPHIDAVRNAITEPWSNGQTEGQINHLKTLKRTMYGRAGSELLRARLLPA